MKNHRTVVAVAGFAMVLGGCASTIGIDPSSLQKTSSNSYVELKETFTWSERFNIDKSTAYYSVGAGKYKAYLEAGEAGTYYEGEAKCLTTKVVADDPKRGEHSFSQRCGIYVPKTSGQRAKIYYYIDAEAAEKAMETLKPGPLIEALDRAERDNLKYLMYQPDEAMLKAAIRLVK